MIVLFYCSYGSFFGMLCNTLSVFCLDLFIRVVFSTFGITLGDVVSGFELLFRMSSPLVC